MRDSTDTAQLVRALFLLIAAVILNLAVGSLVRDVLQWPVYLDSIGTIVVGALLGPLAGAATGALANLIWGGLLGDQSVLPYTITAAFIGWAAGYAAVLGPHRPERDLAQRAHRRHGHPGRDGLAAVARAGHSGPADVDQRLLSPDHGADRQPDA